VAFLANEGGRSPPLDPPLINIERNCDGNEFSIDQKSEKTILEIK